MVSSISNKTNISTKNALKETLLTPRFYTTDFEKMATLNVSSNLEEITSIVEEFRLDYNQQHFIRDNEFLKSWEFFDEKTRNLFIEFLERSCTAEFSGFLLYKEISRNLKKKNPLLAEGFSFMARDEARHAGFLNKAMSDFNITLDLGFLTKSRKYTFFAPKFIFYATYLSEKIGYWRYITIYRSLEKNSEFRIYPIFRFFESWCQDENRHGDFFAALMKSQKNLLTGTESRFWCRFFLLSVFATMYLNDLQRKDFYASIGLDAKNFDTYVIRKTNQSSAKLFPIILDIDNPKFFKILDKCAILNQTLINYDKQKTLKIIKFFKKAPILLLLGIYFLNLYFLKPIDVENTWENIF